MFFSQICSQNTKNYFYSNYSQNVSIDGSLTNPFSFLNLSLKTIELYKNQTVYLNLQTDNEVFSQNESDFFFRDFSGSIKYYFYYV